MKKILFYFTRTPDENSVVIDAFDAVITAAIFDQKISLIFEEAPWNNYFFREDLKDSRQEVIKKKLQTIAAMDNISIYIISDKSPKIESRSHINTNHLLHFLQTACVSTSFIEKKSIPTLIQECDKILSF